jgi:hypothetical protein
LAAGERGNRNKFFSLGCMLSRSSSPQGESYAPILLAMTIVFAVACALFLALYWLMQPTSVPNPGIAAFHPPRGTRVEPLGLDEWERAESSVLRSSFASDYERPLEVAPPVAQPPVIRKQVVVRKPPKSQPNRYENPGNAYAQQRVGGGFWRED